MNEWTVDGSISGSLRDKSRKCSKAVTLIESEEDPLSRSSTYIDTPVLGSVLQMSNWSY